MKVGFIGVGAMGAAMAGHAHTHGFDVMAFDTDANAQARLAEGGITPVESLEDLAIRAQAFVIMVANDAQSKSVVNSLLASTLQEDALIIVTATNHPSTMIELARTCAEKAVGFVDAPVCYGMTGAREGNLISLCGGTERDVERARPILMSYSRSVEHIGGSGSGQLAKTCNNMMHWAACVANYETLALAKACGIDAQAMRSTLLKCPAKNTTLERWDNSKFTWHEKDMDVALELSQSAGLSLPFFGMVDQLIKRLGPDNVRELLHEDRASYLGLEIEPRDLSDVVMNR